MLPQSAKDIVTSKTLAHLVTIAPDGSPRVTVAWTGLDDDGDIAIATLPNQAKLADIRRDPRVAVTFITDVTNPMGLQEYLVVYGTARITEGSAPELLQELASIYIGPGVIFPPIPDPPPGYITHIRPERLGGVGPWISDG